MNKTKFLCTLSLVVIMLFSGCNSLKSYEQAKGQTLEFFTGHRSEFEEAKNTVIKNQSSDGVLIRDKINVNFDSISKSQKITFDFDSQGMLGGQYWGIYYSSDNMPKLDISAVELTEATNEGCYFWQEPDGNNYYATERISKNWFFYYWDYDGNRHNLNWKAK